MDLDTTIHIIYDIHAYITVLRMVVIRGTTLH